MVAPVPTVIPDIDSAQWAEYLLSLFPRDWSSDASRHEGGVLYALFKSMGTNLELTDDNLQYVFKACRIATATDEALDEVAADFFGTIAGYPADVARAPGEPDSSFRRRIYASLLLPSATREAMSLLLERLTGSKPHLVEPGKITDTGAWDCISYWDVDSPPDNPGRWGDPGLAYQGFIDSPLPQFANQGANPIYCFDSGAAWDTYYFLEADANWWINTERLDQLVNKTKPFGTVVWRRYSTQALTNFLIGATELFVDSQVEKIVEIYPPFAGQYAILASANWNTAVGVQPISNNSWELECNVACPPEGGQVDWIGCPITQPGVGLTLVIFDTDEMSLSIPTGFSQIDAFVAVPSWDTNCWIKSRNSTTVVLGFGTAAPYLSDLAFMFFSDHSKSGQITVPANADQIDIPIRANPGYQAFVMPNWNTQVKITKYLDHITAYFSVTPDVNSKVDFFIRSD